MKICPTCQRCYDDAESLCATPGHAALVDHRPDSRVIDGKYRLDRLIGRGGVGVVYAGSHLELENVVAIKLLLPALVDDASALERFRREARAAARLNHPSLAATYDMGMLPDGGAYIVMELVDGPTLRAVLDDARPMPVGEAIAIARKVLDGIDVAHRNGIVHRDLKPSNIILARDHDGAMRPKIVDFGLAKLVEGAPVGADAVTLAGTLIGTPRYMSPEQCAGRELDARSDLYSLGVILFEMLAGRPPFEAPSATALALRHINDTPPDLRVYRRDTPAGLAGLVHRMLAKDPAHRPQTATEVGFELAQIESAERRTAVDAAGAPTRVAPQSDPSRPSTDAASTEPDPPTRITSSSDGAHRSHDGVPSAGQQRPQTEAESPPTNVRSTEARRDRPAASPTKASPDGANRRGARRTTIEPAPKRRSFALPLGLVAIALVALGLWWMSRQEAAIGDLREVPVDSLVAEPMDDGDAGTRQTPAQRDQPASGATERTTTRATPRATPAPRTESLPPDFDREAARSQLQTAIAGWIESTNERDVDAHLKEYAPKLDRFYLQRGASRASVRAEKSRLFSEASDVSMSVGDARVTYTDGGRTATTRFRKEYEITKTDGTVSRGAVIQELVWRRIDGDWRIVSERDAATLPAD